MHVAISPHNRKRVTIDVGQGGDGRPRPVHSDPGQARAFPADAPAITFAMGAGGHSQPSSPDAERISELTKLGQLHSQGVLTDAEFAAEKARLLGQ